MNMSNQQWLFHNIWDGPSHGGNVCCGQTDQYSRCLLEEMEQRAKGRSVFQIFVERNGAKSKRSIQPAVSNQSLQPGSGMVWGWIRALAAIDQLDLTGGFAVDKQHFPHI